MQEQAQTAADMASWNWAPAEPAKYDNRRYLVASYLSWEDSGNRGIGKVQPVEVQAVPLAYAEGYRT